MRVSAKSASGFLIAILALAAPARADEVRISGRADVIDGDTISIGPLKVRLYGIDAAEVGQTCKRAGGGTWDCATSAANRLQQLIGDEPVDCVALEQDVYGRIVATCRATGADLGRQLVAEGLAWAFVRYSDAYATEEATARTAAAGIWQSTSEPPWEYREARWDRAAERSPRPGCPIKGNVSVSNGERIYHTPWSANYERTVIDESKGERWFCDEAEAIAAGWRAARSR